MEDSTDDKEGGNEEKEDIDTNNPDELRQLGNHQFSNGNYEVAAHFYTQALDLLGHDYATSANDSQSCLPPTSLLLNLCNRSACYYQMQLYEQAQTDAAMAWNALPQWTNIKAAYRLAKTLIALNKLEEAKFVIVAQVFPVLDEVQAQAHEEPDNMAAVKTQRRAFDDLLKALEKKQKNDNGGKEPPKLSIRDLTLQDELGFGNFSEIYKVQHKSTGKEFALKRINKKKANDLGQKQVSIAAASSLPLD